MFSRKEKTFSPQEPWSLEDAGSPRGSSATSAVAENDKAPGLGVAWASDPVHVDEHLGQRLFSVMMWLVSM